MVYLYSLKIKFVKKILAGGFVYNFCQLVLQNSVDRCNYMIDKRPNVVAKRTEGVVRI